MPVAALLASLLVATGGASTALAHPVAWDVYYTRFAGSPNLKRAEVRFDGRNIVIGPRRAIAAIEGADGLIFAPDGDLLVGGQGDRVHKVRTEGGGEAVTVSAGGQDSFHLTLDPGGGVAWTSGMPGHLVGIPLQPFSNGITHPLRGGDRTITSIAFDDRGIAFYTAGDHRGGGNFGVIDLETFTTRRLQSNLPAAHSITFDSFTGDLFLFGANQIAQIDPRHPRGIKSSRVFDQESLFDQGTADGAGHVVVARTSGHIVFVDYAVSGLVGDAGNFVAAAFVDSNLDDIAPLAGLGANPAIAAAPAAPAAPTSPGGPGEFADGVAGEAANETPPPAGNAASDSAVPWALLTIALANVLILTIVWGLRMLRATARRAARAEASDTGSAPPGEILSSRQRGADLLRVARRGVAGLIDRTEPRTLVREMLRDTIAATDSRTGAVHAERTAQAGHVDFGVSVSSRGGAHDGIGATPESPIDLPLVFDGAILGHLTLSRDRVDGDGIGEAALAPLAAVLTAILERAATPQPGQHADDARLFGATAKMLRQAMDTLAMDTLAMDMLKTPDPSDAGTDPRSPKATGAPDDLRHQLDRLEETEWMLSHLSSVTFDDAGKETVDLGSIAAEASAALRNRDPARATRITIAPGATAEGNPGRLRAAVEGLLGAAWNADRENEPSNIEFGVTDRGGRAVCFARCHGSVSRAKGPENSPLPSGGETPGTPDIGLSVVRYALGAGARVWTETEDTGPAYFFALSQEKSGEQHPTGWRMPGPGRR